MSRLKALQQAFIAADREMGDVPPDQLVRHCPASYSMRYQFKDESTGEPVEGVLYCVEAGEELHHMGRTDNQGYTLRIHTPQPEQLTMRWSREAAAYLRKKGICF